MRILFVGFILAGAPALTASAETPAAPGYLLKDMHEIVQTMQGRWDNDGHVFFAADAGMDPATVAPREHLIISKVEDSDGTKLRAAKDIAGAVDSELIYAFSTDSGATRVRQSILHTDGSPVGCDVSWARNGDGFSGTASSAGCAEFFPDVTGRNAFVGSMSLAQDTFWLKSSRGSATVEARMRRTRVFSCWASVLRGARHGDSGEGMDDWYFQRGVLLHDQGGEAVLTTDEAPPRKIRLKLRDVDWTFGTNRPSLTLYVHEGDNKRAASYAWAEGGAERIGVNLRWIQASCSHAPDEGYADLTKPGKL